MSNPKNHQSFKDPIECVDDELDEVEKEWKKAWEQCNWREVDKKNEESSESSESSGFSESSDEEVIDLASDLQKK